ncbi:hypothetical protein DFQ04_2769 [Algoriphagus boseongensis]|uniref:Uncharacterized protein n=1 Tax=Algoriphagus boseongensis TaxID=1442587 RepID=A0A4R6T4K1_9BACT|nr:DUF6544 family protein [Algoriphagus boseongensis]TDQ16647.1 hypothetical protein DFQ04_2769 [Algoriphagus boseongensis]
MRILFLILVFLHALIHLLGFIKGFGLKEVKELSLPISKPMGFLWLMAAGVLLLYAISYLSQWKYSWLIGLLAVVLSQVLIVIFWKDAKFATLPNLLILLVSLMAWGQYQFSRMVEKETAALLQTSQAPSTEVIQEKDLEELPEPVKNWLRQSGMLGKPRIHIAKVIQEAEMQLKPDQNWMSAQAIQYSTLDSPGFIWSVEVKMNGFLSFRGRDKYEEGKGQMLIKLNSLIPIVNEQGEKLDEGTLQRFLGEMVWFPSFALSPYLRWETLSDSSAKATLSYGEIEGSGIFEFNSKGEVTKFSALRYQGNKPDAQRKEWIMDIEDYETFEGIQVPSKVHSTWKDPNQSWTWLKLQVKEIRYNQNALN